MVIAEMVKPGESQDVSTGCYKHWTPEFCVRRGGSFDALDSETRAQLHRVSVHMPVDERPAVGGPRQCCQVNPRVRDEGLYVASNEECCNKNSNSIGFLKFGSAVASALLVFASGQREPNRQFRQDITRCRMKQQRNANQCSVTHFSVFFEPWRPIFAMSFPFGVMTLISRELAASGRSQLNVVRPRPDSSQTGTGFGSAENMDDESLRYPRRCSCSSS